MNTPHVLMGSGPTSASIMIVGEFWSPEDEVTREPFSGSDGRELDRMLLEAGIHRSECYTTNVVNARPPYNELEKWLPLKKTDIKPNFLPLNGRYVDPVVVAGYNSLLKEIALIKPKIIIAMGNLACWALTGESSALKWRGSMLSYSGTKLLPTLSPRMVMYNWEWRADVVNDLRRARRWMIEDTPAPKWNILIRPSFEAAQSTLNLILLLLAEEVTWIDCDLETRAGHIACCGLSWSATNAICIPLMCVENREGYWSLEEEAVLVHLIYLILTHGNARVRGQNFSYDMQYIHRHWHFLPRCDQDTMLSQHTLFAGRRKSLDYQASLYCDHYVYWKDDGKTWVKGVDEDQLWRYNAIDCFRTREVGEVEADAIISLKLDDVEAFQQRFLKTVVNTMLRGVRIDTNERKRFANTLEIEIAKRARFFSDLLGHPLNPKSPKQMQQLFFDDLRQPKIYKRTKDRMSPTLDDDALTKLGDREPILRPLIKSIKEYRSLGVFLSTFVLAPLDVDGRMRCSYNVAGTETYRLASSENAFGSGTNLQNVPKGTKAKDPDELTLPNVRSLFIPDEGFEFFDMDLDRADLQVVVWEAEDSDLKEVLRKGIDMHLFNACDIFGIKGIPPEELIESHPNYSERRASITEVRRQLAKAGCHAVNYFCQARTLATHLGGSVHEAQHFIDSWLGAHPGIKQWHTRTENQLRKHRFVENKFGYRRYYFDRVEGLLPEALAWTPQSTVACVINRAWVNIDEQLPECQVLLQVHDSLAGQYPVHKRDMVLARMKELSTITIPYDDPLVIPVGIKTSTRSWGHCS